MDAPRHRRDRHQYGRPQSVREGQGGPIDLIKKYLDLTDKPIIVEIDGHSLMDHPMTAQWNKVFMDAWQDMDRNGLLGGVPVQRE